MSTNEMKYLNFSFAIFIHCSLSIACFSTVVGLRPSFFDGLFCLVAYVLNEWCLQGLINRYRYVIVAISHVLVLVFIPLMCVIYNAITRSMYDCVRLADYDFRKVSYAYVMSMSVALMAMSFYLFASRVCKTRKDTNRSIAPSDYVLHVALFVVLPVLVYTLKRRYHIYDDLALFLLVHISVYANIVFAPLFIVNFAKFVLGRLERDRRIRS